MINQFFYINFLVKKPFFVGDTDLVKTKDCPPQFRIIQQGFEKRINRTSMDFFSVISSNSTD